MSDTEYIFVEHMPRFQKTTLSFFLPKRLSNSQ